ncbi:uncharacterized protein [Miscanthus floridulus]|uniref:uncharacterized protein n=1 Tax=Miscanthus floridulus TaxID=154761 RepID=UPI003459F721
MRALRAWGSRPSRRRWGPQRHRRPPRRRGVGTAALAARVPAIPARAGAPAALATRSRPPVRAWLLRPPLIGWRAQARRLRPPRRGRGARELQSHQSGKPPHTRRGVRMPRPEFQAAQDVFYESEVPKYTTSSRIVEIQSRISERTLELLALPNDGVPKLLLDIGCGSGLSGETLMEHGHHWIVYDISKLMLDVALLMEESASRRAM